MKFETKAHRFADVVLQQPEFVAQYNDIVDAIVALDDARLIAEFEKVKAEKQAEKKPWSKSLSGVINTLLHKELASKEGWRPQSPIFQDGRYGQEINDKWTLDFASRDISVEVAFNNAGSTAWNLLKPVLASELNHVTKAVQTKIGVVVVATQELKVNGGFDNAIGTYESFANTYLPTMQNVLTIPILLIGLKAPETFRMRHSSFGGKRVGDIELLNIKDSLAMKAFRSIYTRKA